jgi:hypothetical protein
MRKIISIFATFVFISCGTKDNPKNNHNKPIENIATNPEAPSDWTFDKVEKSNIVFKNGQSFETKLFELEYIGQVSSNNKKPYLIFSGCDCQDCDANISIYIHSPLDGAIIVEHGQNRYQYPGTETDYETDSTLCISRAFYGQVLENINGVIWYENRLLENGKMGRIVFLSKIENEKLIDTLYIDNGNLDETLNLLNKRLCIEIQGRKYSSEP